MIPYGFVKKVSLPFNTVLKKVPVELRKNGLEVLSKVRLDSELRKNLGIDFKQYAILGVSNLTLSYKALIREEELGLLFYTNVIVYEKDSYTIVASMRPTKFMPIFQDEVIANGAELLERKLAEVLDTLCKKRNYPANNGQFGYQKVII